MLTRSRARATNQPMFVDEAWTDSFVQTKDQEIEAMHASDPALGWDHLREEDSDASSEAGSGSDAWRSDDEANADSDEEDDDEEEEDADDDGVDSFARRWVAGGSWAQNVAWTLATASGAPLLLYAAVQHRRLQSYVPYYSQSDLLVVGQVLTAGVTCSTPTTILTLTSKRVRRRWPLQSASFAGLLTKVALNMVTLAGLALLGYTAACSTLDAESALDWKRLEWRALELRAPAECSAGAFPDCWAEVSAFRPSLTLAVPQSADEASRLWDDAVDAVSAGLAVVLNSAQCVDAMRQAAAIAVAALAILCLFHRAVTKLLVVSALVAYVAANATTEWQRQQRARVQITAVDPTFAFANESIFVRPYCVLLGREVSTS